MNVHSWQGLVAGTCGHQTRYLDQRFAQKPKCIVLLAKMSLQDFTTSSGQKDLHAWSSMHVLVRGSNRILISHTLINILWGFWYGPALKQVSKEHRCELDGAVRG